MGLKDAQRMNKFEYLIDILTKYSGNVGKSISNLLNTY